MLEKFNNDVTITNMAESLDIKQKVDEPITTKRNLWFLIERLRESQENQQLQVEQQKDKNVKSNFSIANSLLRHDNQLRSQSLKKKEQENDK